MNFSDVPVPEVYLESADFRFFLNWFEYSLTQIKYDTENLFDLYDPQRCPSDLLWLLGDTMGYKFDSRLPVAFNRLVLLYFMSMIYSKGSKNGLTLAAEVNLAQFNLINYANEKEILEDRLEDTSIPANSVYVTPNPKEGYIDVVYFSDKLPTDACIEYVRPVGMYCFQNAGVRVDARTKISVDARLTNYNDLSLSVGPTHVGHYRRDDYAAMQKMKNESSQVVNGDHERNPVWYRNSDAEVETSGSINPGFIALSSLQLSNNEHLVDSLVEEPIFSVGFGPQDVSVTYPDDYYSGKYKDTKEYNLLYNRQLEESITQDVYTVDSDRTEGIMNPRPAVNPVMTMMGDAISLNDTNTSYTDAKNGSIVKSEE